MGHATRCIPIVNALIKAGFEPVLASDGAALKVLKEAFPALRTYELPGYNITYSKSSWSLKLRLLLAFPRIRKVIRKERAITSEIVVKENISGIISDNRFGVRHSEIPSVYITHQLRVFSGIFTSLTTKIHQKIIEKFDACWVPDEEGKFNLSGQLSEEKNLYIPVKRIGFLSRLEPCASDTKYDLAIVLSGPEPQRSMLEQKILAEFKDEIGKSILVRGIFSEKALEHDFQNLEVVNYANESQMNAILNGAEVVISRSGYSTLMDLAVLGKKALFVPTPGQTEQEYLAMRLQTLKTAPLVQQSAFKFSALHRLKDFSGFEKKPMNIDLKLFSLFHSE